MRKSALIYHKFFMLLAVMVLVLLICWIAVARLLVTTSYAFIFVNSLLFALNTFTHVILTNVIIQNHLLKEVFEVGFEVIQVTMSAFAVFLPVINENYVIWTSFLMPLPAMTWTITLGTIAANRNISIEIGGENEVIGGNNMTTVMHMALYQFLIKLVVCAWVLPVTVYNDEQASRGFLYLC